MRQGAMRLRRRSPHRKAAGASGRPFRGPRSSDWPLGGRGGPARRAGAWAAEGGQAQGQHREVQGSAGKYGAITVGSRAARTRPSKSLSHDFLLSRTPVGAVGFNAREKVVQRPRPRLDERPVPLQRIACTSSTGSIGSKSSLRKALAQSLRAPVCPHRWHRRSPPPSARRRTAASCASALPLALPLGPRQRARR